MWLDLLKSSYGWDVARGAGSVSSGIGSDYSFYNEFSSTITPEIGTGGTFTRSGTSNYFSSETAVSTAASGVTALNAFAAGLRTNLGGAKIYGSVTNNCTRSNTLGTTWSHYLNATATNNTTDLTAPDGTNTSTKVVAPVDDAGRYISVALSPQSRKVVISGWGKVATGTLTGYLWIQASGAPDEGTGTTFTLTDTWQRFSYYKEFTAGAGGAAMYFTVGQNTGTAYWWGLQVEDASTLGTKFPGTYVPTTDAAASSNADVLTYPSSNIASATAGSIHAMIAPGYSSDLVGAEKKYVFSCGGIEIWLEDGNVYASYSTATISGAASWQENEWWGIALTWDNSGAAIDLRLYVNGILLTSDTASTPANASIGTIYVGSQDSAAASEYFDGCIADLTIMSRQFTASEIRGEYDAVKTSYGWEPDDPGIVTFSKTTLTEQAGGAGAVSDTLTITLANDSFAVSSGALTRNVHYTLTGTSVPSGLTMVLTADSASQVTVSLTGTATAHTTGDSVTGVILTLLDALFVSGVAPSTGSQSLGISFIDTTCTWSGVAFEEAGANDGSVSTTKTVTLANDTYVAAPWTGGVHYTFANVPAGLTGVLTRTSGTVATISFTGNAAAHAYANSVTNVTLDLEDAIFTSTAAPSDSTGSNTLSITFQDPAPAAGSINLRGADYVINAHPRMFLTAGRLATLQARSTTANRLWTLMTSYCNTRVTYTSSADILDSFLLALGYVCDPTQTTWRDTAITVLLNFCALPTSSINYDYGSESLMHLSCCYDWLYGDLTAGNKTTIQTFVHSTLLPHLRTHPYDHHQSPLIESGHNLTTTKLCAEMMWGLAACGDLTDADDLLKWNYDWWIDTAMANFDVANVGGCNYSGSHYAHVRVVPFTCWVQDCLETALTGMTGYRAWTESVLSYWLHSMLPNKTMYHCYFEPGNYTWNNGRESEVLPLIIQKYTANDTAKYMQYMLVNDWPISTFYFHRYYLPWWHLTYEPSQTATDYSAADLSYVATGCATGFTRSAWGSSTSVWAVLQNASHYGDHEICCNGSFKIFRNGEYLVIENSRNYGGPASGSSVNPQYCNILWLGDGIVSGTTTGGLPLRFGSRTGTIEDHTTAATYTYMMANMDSVYPSAHAVSYARRHFAHFRPSGSTSNYIVVMDGVSTTASETKKVIFHVCQNPTIAGSQAYFTTASNKLTIEKVYPTSSSIALEVVTDNTSGPTQAASDVPTRVYTSASAGNSEVFLHVFLPGATTATMPTLTALVNGAGTMKGVLIADASYNRVFMAPNAGSAIDADITVAVTVTTTCEFLVVGLPANQKYDISLAGGTLTMTRNAGGAYTATADGVLRFEI